MADTESMNVEASKDAPDGVDPLKNHRCKLLLPLGRGSRGKSLISRYVLEQALLAGRSPIVADADRTNPTLGKYFEGVISPPSAEDADVIDFIADLIEEQAKKHFDVILDLGGGDLILKKIAGEMNFQSWLPKLGIDVTAVHLLGPSADDLSYLRSLEEGETGPLLAPPATILVLNEGTVPPNMTAHAAFSAAINAHPIMIATVARGARVVSMPRLQTAPDIEAAQLLFHQASADTATTGKTPLGVWKSQQTAMWLRQMQRNFDSVAHWLP